MQCYIYKCGLGPRPSHPLLKQKIKNARRGGAGSTLSMELKEKIKYYSSTNRMERMKVSTSLHPLSMNNMY